MVSLGDAVRSSGGSGTSTSEGGGREDSRSSSKSTPAETVTEAAPAGVKEHIDLVMDAIPDFRDSVQAERKGGGTQQSKQNSPVQKNETGPLELSTANPEKIAATAESGSWMEKAVKMLHGIADPVLARLPVVGSAYRFFADSKDASLASRLLDVAVGGALAAGVVAACVASGGILPGLALAATACYAYPPLGMIVVGHALARADKSGGPVQSQITERTGKEIDNFVQNNGGDIKAILDDPKQLEKLMNKLEQLNEQYSAGVNPQHRNRVLPGIQDALKSYLEENLPEEERGNAAKIAKDIIKKLGKKEDKKDKKDEKEERLEKEDKHDNKMYDLFAKGQKGKGVVPQGSKIQAGNGHKIDNIAGTEQEKVVPAGASAESE